MIDIYKQYDLAKPCDRGETHWIAWFDDAALKTALEDGWKIHKSWNTKLIRSRDGVLVEPQ